MSGHFLNSAVVGVAGQRTLPASAYLSPETWAAELENIWNTRWICVCRESDLPAPGSFVQRELGPESLIIVKDQKGEVHAHFNVCRHRGTRLCEEQRGKFSGSIQCPYHAWTYGLDGRLMGVPDLETMNGLRKEEHGLHPAAVARWEGFVFVNLAREPQPFSEAFAPLINKWTAWNLPNLIPLAHIAYDVAANWKLVMENYSECYHCSPLHPSLVKLSPSNSGGNDLREGAFLGGYMDVTKKGGSLTTSGRACGLPVGPLGAEDLQRVYYYTLFPNVLLSLHHDYVMVHTLWPKGPGRTLIECEWLFHPDTAKTQDFDPQEGVRFWDQVNKEDWHVSELTQLGVASSRYAPGPYSSREAMSAAWDREYLRAMAG